MRLLTIIQIKCYFVIDWFFIFPFVEYVLSKIFIFLLCAILRYDMLMKSWNEICKILSILIVCENCWEWKFHCCDLYGDFQGVAGFFFLFCDFHGNALFIGAKYWYSVFPWILWCPGIDYVFINCFCIFWKSLVFKWSSVCFKVLRFYLRFGEKVKFLRYIFWNALWFLFIFCTFPGQIAISICIM